MQVYWEGMILILALATSLLLVAAFREYARRYLLDVAGDRSSHQGSIPRGGGMVWLLFWLSGGVLFANPVSDPVFWLVPVIAGVTGLWEDRFGIHWFWRLTIFVVTGMLLAWRYASGLVLPLGNDVLVFGIMACPLVGLAAVWLINLFNFMDGIDGILVIEGISVLLSAWLLGGFPGPEALLLWLLGAMLGFLVFNWPRASLFAGDSGSYFLGALVAVCLFASIDAGLSSLWQWMILLAVFWVDASWTLLVRGFTGQHLFSPHRLHAYQKLALRCRGHALVSAGVGVYNLVYLLPLAWWAGQTPSQGVLCLMLAIMPVAWMCWRLEAGKMEPAP